MLAMDSFATYEEQLRKFPRFNVSHYEGIGGDLGPYSNEKLISLGQGGCGFYGLSEARNLIPPKRVYCRLYFPTASEEPMELQGNLIYVRPYNISTKLVYYYGIEFLQVFHGQIEPLIQQLERLAGEGKVIPM